MSDFDPCIAEGEHVKTQRHTQRECPTRIPEVVSITSMTGVRFNVRILRTGDRYGLDNCLTVGEGNSLRLEGHGPFVEFYDSRYPHTEFGQFVSRYGVSTIIGDGCTTGGLDLLTYIDAWKIDSAAMTIVRAWLRHEVSA